MFNLDTLALKDTFELHLRHPISDELLYTDEDKTEKVSINLYGTASKQYRNATRAMQNRHLKRDKKKVTAELLQEESLDILVACSESANNLAYKGKPVEGEDHFRALYSDPAFSWLKDQVDAALGDISNFLEQ